MNLKRFRDSAGMTLIELMIVLFIMGVLAMVAVPRVAPSLNQADFESGADAVLSELRFARNRAINLNTNVGVNIDDAAGNLTIQVLTVPGGVIIHDLTFDGPWQVNNGAFNLGPRFSPRGLPSSSDGLETGGVINIIGPGGRVRNYQIWRTTGFIQ